MRLLLYALALFCAIFALSGTASAVVLDWSALSWTPGSLSNSYDVDPASPGNDVTVTVSGDTARLQPASVGGQQTPAITSNIEGGFGAGHMSLQMGIDLTSNTQGVTITIDFSSLYVNGVANVSFNIFDIDMADTGGNGSGASLCGRDSVDYRHFYNRRHHRANDHRCWPECHPQWQRD